MGNFIMSSMLKPHFGALLNRDSDGFAKQIIVGGLARCRISSQCLKRVIRASRKWSSEVLRTSHIEDLVESLLKIAARTGDITEEDADKLGDIICRILGGKWEIRESKVGRASKDDEGKGRTITAATPFEIVTVYTTVLNLYKVNKEIGVAEEEEVKETEEAETKDKKDKKKKKASIAIYKDAVDKVLATVPMCIEKAMFGTMVADNDSAFATIDGAVEITQSISIDELVPENDFGTATFSRGGAVDDPYAGAFDVFAGVQESRRESQTMFDSWLTSNTMFTGTTVNIDYLKNNLGRSTLNTKLDIAEEMLMDTITSVVSEYLAVFPLADPTGKQHSASSHPVPVIYYLEYIKDGDRRYPIDLSKVIRNTRDKSITEQGVERFLEFAKDETFREGEIHRYVMLSAGYKQYEKDFAEAGVIVIKNLKELKAVTEKEIRRLNA